MYTKQPASQQKPQHWDPLNLFKYPCKRSGEAARKAHAVRARVAECHDPEGP